MYAKNLQNTQQSPIKTKLCDPTEKKMMEKQENKMVLDHVFP